MMFLKFRLRHDIDRLLEMLNNKRLLFKLKYPVVLIMPNHLNI